MNCCSVSRKSSLCSVMRNSWRLLAGMFKGLASCLLALCLLFLVLFVACTTDTYDTGDGSLSYLRADFVEAYTNADGLLVSASTDDGDSLTFAAGVEKKWATTPDSVYRALLYYNKVEGAITPLSLSQVFVPQVRMASDLKTTDVTHPVEWESAWISRGGRYLNLGLQVKTGTTDGGTAQQSIGVVCDTVLTRNDGSREVQLHLLHDQKDVPEYYSVDAYLSIRLDRLPIALQTDDEITLTVNTYDGIATKTFRR